MTRLAPIDARSAALPTRVMRRPSKTSVPSWMTRRSESRVDAEGSVVIFKVSMDIAIEGQL